ncbi:hypothetical protein [Hymenobacter swuensis]|uniref:hypothetical protein n=1 Tax=Hymenobacter swuensis TaxID=1446467 RepID=UPI0012DEA092|nr:hypothetical protein [Hymenobacter swuensis]
MPPGSVFAFLAEAERTAILAEMLYQEQQRDGNEIVQPLRISTVTRYTCPRLRGVVIHRHRKASAGKPTAQVMSHPVSQLP